MAEKILVIDDDLDSLKLIGLMLQRSGYEVIVANSGQQALIRADAERPSLVILDVMMPDMDGLEVCRRLRENPRTQQIPIIMFTAKTMIDDKVKGFEAGADDYLTKPTHPAELSSRVKAILARSHQQSPIPGSGHSMAIGVLGAKGGVGTSTIALNLAAALGDDQPILADFRLGRGTIGLATGHGSSQGMARIVSKAADEITADVVTSELVTLAGNIRGLLSSARPAEANIRLTPQIGHKIIEVLRSLGGTVILDLGAGLNAFNHAILADLDRIILIVEPNTIAIELARQIAQSINDHRSHHLSVVIMERAQTHLRAAWHEFEQPLGQEIAAVISAAPELANQAIETKTPMILLQPSAVVCGQIRKLAEDLKGQIQPTAGGQFTI